MKRTRWFGVIIAVLCAGSGFGQVPGVGTGILEEFEAVADEDPTNRLLLAVSSPHYPVTPGDTYELTVADGGQVTTSVVTVESNGRVNLNLFGEINTDGMTYPQLKREVERAVRRAYPQSQPSFRLISVGQFEVRVSGAIHSTTTVNAWGLSRLSDVVQPLIQPYSSRRRVVVSSTGGPEQAYDAFRAIAMGEQDQDPYVEPGDSIRIPPVGPLVTVRGEVNRPGTYEILPGELMWDVILYAGGPSPDADVSNIQLDRRTRIRTSADHFDLTEGTDGPEVQDGDRITVETIQRGWPLVFIEGALRAEEDAVGVGEGTQTIELIEDDLQDEEMSYVRITEPYYEGNTLHDVLSPYRDRLNSFADLGRTLVIREGTEEVIHVDASRVLYGDRGSDNIQIQPFDTVFIPSRRISVLVTGPVAEPGLYLYVPGQTPEYYIGRAGGYDREISAGGDYTLFDRMGNRRSAGSKVQPGDRIEVERDNFIYQYNRHFPVIISSLGIVTTVISLLMLINQ